MPSGSDPLIDQMQSYIQLWQSTCDDKALFLRCYMMMTSNVITAVSHQEFHDPPWVTELIHRFAAHYFTALQSYEQDPAAAPPVWQQAHQAANDPHFSALQKLLSGINAHINYDLVLTLVEMLQVEWVGQTVEMRNGRYTDHCHINHIIGCTIDAVQDEILEPAMPIMDILDNLLGPIDERLLGRLIARWREKVWQNATCLLEMQEPQERELFIKQVEQDTLRIGKLICHKKF